MEKDDVDEWKLATIYPTSVNHQVLAVKGRSRFGSLLTAESTNSRGTKSWCNDDGGKVVLTMTVRLAIAMTMQDNVVKVNDHENRTDHKKIYL